EEHDDSNPFFMYVAYTAAHWPMHARERDIKKYDGRYDNGYDAIRKERFERMKKLGLIGSAAKMSSTVGEWESVEDKEWESACMETYAAMVDQMDQGIGRIVKALKKKGQFENTLILFFQDNGACAENLDWIDTGTHGPRASTPTLDPIPDSVIHYYESAPSQTRDGWPVLFSGVLPGPADTYMAYRRAWANVSNTPFREYKHWVHEGGISTPLIAHWPKGIKAKNELRNEPGHLVDLMATCVDIAGAIYPSTVDDQSIWAMEGKSLVPVFENKEIDRDLLFWEHEGNRALRIGKWKIVAKGLDGGWELYDIETDRSELTNLATVYPERLESMAAKWEAEAVRLKVLPRSPKNKE
ncbi:sulfatase-like hydrolase/transferase, partial [Bacteroidota bacterium]